MPFGIANQRGVYLLGNLDLVVFADSEAGTRHGKLDDKNGEEDDHVDEERHLNERNSRFNSCLVPLSFIYPHLLVLYRSIQTRHGDEEQKYPAGHDPADNLEAGDDVRGATVGANANQDERHHLQRTGQRSQTDKQLNRLLQQLTT